MGELLEMRGISKAFSNVNVLDNVSFTLKRGSVHALMGENGAGKSTLIKCLAGMYTPTEGEIYINGELQNFSNTSQALKKGIAVIHQELTPVLERNVMENIWLGREPLKFGCFIDYKKMYQMTKELLGELSLNIDPHQKMKNCSIAQMQMIEIAKALSYHANIIAMDEPTSSLTTTEVEQLFRIIARLKGLGIGIIYVSHKMDEIFRVCDEITVLRDGKYILTDRIDAIDMNQVILKMVGRELKDLFPKVASKKGEAILQVEGLTSGHAVQNASFELKKGEIMGVAGLVGAGRTELMEALFGIRPKSGSIKIRGKSVTIESPADAIAEGIAMLTEDRRLSGIVPMLSVGYNMLLVNLKKYENKCYMLNRKYMRNDIQEYMSKLKVRAISSDVPIQTLSGGNQQKALIARWLLMAPDILILDEPTRGIDIGAKSEIYTLISKLASEGKSIIMVSSELPEILGMSDRIMVMHEGKVTGILDNTDIDQSTIMKYATNKV